MKKAIFIVGPTAVGKTGFAAKLTHKFPSVLISADSVQVYRGASIISGKDHPKDTKVFIIDEVSPFENFSVSEFVKKVKPVVKKALHENKIPIIVGGTGFYAESLFQTIDTINIPPNKKLRKSLATLSLKELQKKLGKLDSIRLSKMNESDIKNKRRLIRAIEVASSKIVKTKPIFAKNEVLFIGLKTSITSLRNKIKKRVGERLKNGAIQEAEKMFANYKNLSPQIKSANGYKQLFDYLFKKTNLEEAVKRWEIAENQHAKKQMTWFARNKSIVWFDIEKRGLEKEILRLILSSIDTI